MMIRRYVVKDMPEAVIQIRKELGKDAVILSSKRITLKKWMGLWRYKRLEVLAATGDDIPMRVHSKPAPSTREPASMPVQRDYTRAVATQRTLDPVEHRAGVPADDVVHPAPTLVNQVAPKLANDAAVVQLDDMRRQIEEMRAMLQSNLRPPAAEPSAPLIGQLMKQGVQEETVTRLLGEVKTLPSFTGNAASDGLVREALVRRMVHQLGKLGQSRPIGDGSRVVALIGPTGVGKTTTLAKLAAMHVLNGKRKVGLLTADTFRIAAVDQLRTYANILNVPLEVVYLEDELPKALDRLSEQDLILIDTAGRNFRVDAHVEEVQTMLRRTPVDETCLVLSMTSKSEDLDELAHAFSHIPMDKFIFTKLDETSTYGAMLNLVTKYHKPWSYLTTGQNVPDDIEVASVETILRSILGGAAGWQTKQNTSAN